MSLYTGAPPYEEACDMCHAAGPASYTEDGARDDAEKAGWACDHGPECEDFCPTCQKSDAFAAIECGSCPWCRDHNGERAEPVPTAAEDDIP